MSEPAWETNGGSAALAAKLRELDIAVTTVEHPPVHTVDDALPYWGRLEGMHTKNLFLKDARGVLWLVAMPADKRADLKTLARALEAKRFSFASADTLLEVLGLTPGSVSPLALINDAAAQVRLALDDDLAAAPVVTFHPLTNTATVAIRQADLTKFLVAIAHPPVVVRVDPAQ